jgi:hypothetical protein
MARFDFIVAKFYCTFAVHLPVRFIGESR